MKKYQREILWGISDPHAWFKFGLLNPETKIIDPKSKEAKGVLLNSWQEFLWETYTWGKDEVLKLAGKDDIHVISMGDLTHGNHYASEQISTRASDQIIAACYNFKPILQIKNVKSLKLAVGTASHVFGEGTSDLLVADHLQLEYPRVETKVVYHGFTKIADAAIDFSHHGPGPGRLHWSKGNTARNYLKSMLMDDVSRNRPTANLVLRGHYHEYIREWATYRGKSAWIVIMPPMCFMGDYGEQAMKSHYYIAPGTVAVEIINGNIVEIYPFVSEFDTRDIE